MQPITPTASNSQPVSANAFRDFAIAHLVSLPRPGFRAAAWPRHQLRSVRHIFG
jgi:hypothetical protein